MSKIPELPEDFEKRAKGKLVGKRGSAFLEISEDDRIKELARKLAIEINKIVNELADKHGYKVKK
jgi:hypothetical protein